MTQENAVKKRIFSFDLDMTLLDHKTWEVPPSAMEALEHIRKDSVIVIASGRNMDHEMSSMYCDIIKPDGVIHMNGTRVVAGGNVLFEQQMDKDRLRSLLSYADEHGYSMGISTGGYDYYIHPEGVTRMDEIRWGVSERNYRDGWELMELPVRTLAYIGGPQGAKEMEEHFPDFKFPMFSGNMGADVVEREASKAKGLMRICEFYGIGMEHTIAFGDSMNDYEIVREAGIGIAMGNSVDELKAVADYVTDDIDRDGVWKACRHFGWI